MRQEKAVRDYAKANGFTIRKIFRDEGVSGILEDRPALARLLLNKESLFVRIRGMGVCSFPVWFHR